VFRRFAEAGNTLLDLHVHYEKQREYPLKRVEKPNAKLDWRVERMKLNKDRAELDYNEFLTLAGVPQEVFEYRLGNRSALEWVIDQYRVTRNDDGDIVRDPNRANDEQYVVRLIGQVITISMETLRICKELPALSLPSSAPATLT
jgi:predicted helicase